uniref:Ribonuclease A-domain domain-containing protein n=1 Tax=Pseudonaja textilis TaxID=8673 RepID=A0A670ZMD5_PSETE
MLASKISCLLVLSLAFLLGALLVVPSQGQSWAAFKNKHIDSKSQYPPHNMNLYCENQIRNRRMTSPRCKPHNTFISAPASIQAVCGPAGEPTVGDLRESNSSFPLTLCKLYRGSWAPDCNYIGTSAVNRIIIACEDGYPVHLETEVPGYMELEE